MQGLGQALSEACTFTDGRMDNPNLLDYKIFSALDAPAVEVHLIQHPCDSGPLGAKGVGEPPIIPPPAVMANAVFDAVGVRIHDLPITPGEDRHRDQSQTSAATVTAIRKRIAGGLVLCLTNRLANLLVFFAVGCVALPRVVTATRAGLKPAPTSHRALPTTKNPAHLCKPICETQH